MKRSKIILFSVLGPVLAVLAIALALPDESRLLHQIQIDAPPAAVWATLADLEAVAAYNPGVVRARYISGQRRGPGAARECELADGMKIKERVIAAEANRSITMELYESDWPVRDMRWETRLTPRAGGTFVEQELRYRMKLGPAGKLMNVLMLRGRLERSLDEIFASMKDHIEDNRADATDAP